MNEFVDYYLEKYRNNDRDSAFFGLIEASSSVLPILCERYRVESEHDVREFIVRVVREHRNPTAIQFLAEALHDASPEVWKQAMDGLVTLASEEAAKALVAARSRTFAHESYRTEFLEWLEEAIEQAGCKSLNTNNH